MKRRLKLTPFAKIVFVLIIIVAARYVYIHRDEIKKGQFFNFKDTTEVAFLDTNFVILPSTDTVIFYLRDNDSSVQININDTEVHILKDSSGFVSDTIVFPVSESKNLEGKLIVK
jgi:hypothetical protein